jgi:hypothetical protein
MVYTEVFFTLWGNSSSIILNEKNRDKKLNSMALVSKQTIPTE